MRTQRNIYLKKLNKRVLIFDGAMGTSLQALHLTAENFGGESYHGCNDHLNLTNPSSVSKVHNSFLDVGVDVIETNTFRSNRITLAEFGLADKTDRINRMGAQIARKAAESF